MAKATKAEEQRHAEEQKEPNKRRRIESKVTGEHIKGLYYRWGTQANGKPERIFYAAICRGDGKPIETKLGREKTDDVSSDRAIARRDELLRGKPTPKEIREDETREAEAEKEAEAKRKTFDDLWKLYLDANPAYSRKKTDESNYKKYIEPVVGKKTPDEVTYPEVDQIHKLIGKAKGRKGQKHVSPATTKNILALFVRIATWAVENLRVPGLNVPVKLPEVHNEVIEELTNEETVRLLTILRDGSYVDEKGKKQEISRDAIDIVYLAISTGMRRGEILKTEWKNVNFEKGFIFIPKPKEKEPKRIPMNPIVTAVLESRKDNGSAFVFPSRNWKKKDGHLVDPKRALSAIKVAAGLPADFRPCHGYRHVFAGMLMSSGEVPLYTLGKLLGHRSIKTTERYTRLIDKTLTDASNVAGRILALTEAPSIVIPINSAQ